MPRIDARARTTLPWAACLTLLAALGDAAVWAQSASPAPNVLIVTVDTLRPDALGWVAGKNATPRIDELAREGFRFPSAVSSVPLTLPAHASIFSGLYPRNHGVRDNGQVVPGSTPLLAELLLRRGYATAAFVSGYPLRRPFGLDRGFETYDDRLPLGIEGWLERRAPQTVEAALQWLAQTAVDRAWFLWIHFYDPHDPYEPGSAFWRPGELGNYHGEVAQVDEAIGRLRSAVAQRTGRQTITVFTADHGEAFGEHDEYGHGFFIYDATIRVPLVFSAPGSIAGGASDAAVRHVDVLPTLLDLLRIESPSGGDGHSLLPLLRGKPESDPPAALVESMQPWTTYGWAPLRGVIADGWKLIAAPRAELFDLTHDPYEASNRVDSDRRRAASLRDRLAALERRPAATAAASDDPQALESLRALGYLGGSRVTAEPPAGLPDPKDRLPLRDALHGAERRLRAGDFTGSLAAFENVLRVDPENRFAILRSGMAQLKRGDAVAALPLLQKAVQADPEQAEARYALADALTQVGRLPEAAREWQETVRRQPRRVAAWSNLGLTLARQELFEGAERALERALDIDPAESLVATNLSAVRFARALAAAHGGHQQEAREALMRAIAGDPALRSRAEAEPLLQPLLP